MKKLVINALMIFAFIMNVSCDKDDDDTLTTNIVEISINETEDSSILGLWKYNQFFIDGKEEILSDCEKSDTIEFIESGIVISTSHDEDQNTGQGCGLSYENHGTWESLGNSTYLITQNDEEDNTQVSFYVEIRIESDKMIILTTNKDENGELEDEKYVFESSK